MNTIIKAPAKPFNSLKLALAIQLAVASSSAWPLQIGCPAEKIKVNISAQEMDKALNELAQESGFKVIFYSDVVKGIKAKAIAGEYESCEKAIDALLTGTGLRYSVINENAVAIHEEDQSSANYALEGMLLAANGDVSIGLKGRAKSKTVNKAVVNRKFGTIEEVIVTATKRAESIQDVPISISAVNASDIEQMGASKLSDLDHSTPNLVFTSPDAGAQIGIRGISDGSRNMGTEMRVGVYIDGIYNGRASSVNQDLLDIERVEVLRGPQGTLFGKDTIAGAISIITQKPDNEFRGKVSLNSGNYNQNTIKTSINIPLVEDSLYSKFSLVHKERDGYIKNIFPGQPDYKEQNYTTGRVQLRALLSDLTDAMLSIEYTDQNYAGDSGEPNGHTRSDNAPGVHIGNLSQVQKNDLETKRFSLTLNHEFGDGFELTSLSSYRETSRDLSWEEDQAEYDMANLLFSDQELQTSQELRISSPVYNKFNYVAGLYYFHQGSSTLRTADTQADFVLPGLELKQTGNVKTDSYAAFFHSQYEITDKWSATFGIRYTHEEKEILYNQAGAPLFVNIDNFNDNISEEVWSPSVGLSYTMTNGNLLYASISQGFKGGGWNADYVNSTDIGFESEFATNYEIGAKTQWLNDLLRVNLALFQTKFTDFQVFSVRALSTGGALFTLTNAGKVTTQGAELELITLPLEGLSISAGLGYTDATYDEYKNGGGAGIHYDGNTLPYAPKVTSNLRVKYDLILSDDVKAYFNIGYSYRSSVYFDSANTNPTFYADSFGIVDSKIGLLFLEDSLEISMWGKNLTDSEHELSKWITFTGNSMSRHGDPRTYGIEVNYIF